uniref:SGNH domain-containing protein n=1 Tax=Panagrolaimus sp. ES5 TaxID=591445 RepID=A0AC34FMX8_9BILA
MPENVEYCEYNTNPEATLTAIIVGNSYAMNLQYAIVKNPTFRKVILIYALGCPFPYVNDKGKGHCKKAAEAMKRLIGEVEPDIVYLIQGYIGYMKKRLENNWKNNWKFKKWNEMFQFIQKHSSAIIVNQEQLYFPYEVGKEFSKRKSHGRAFDGRMRKPVCFCF